MRIKLFESFSDENQWKPKIKSDIKDIFVELCDSGFDVNVITYFTKNQYYVNIERIDKKLFDVDIIEEYDLMLKDYLQDVLPGFKIEYLLYSNDGLEYAREYELGSGYLPRLVIKVIGEDENS
jgi:uncharacterized protein (UPF0335 family)